MLIGPQAQYVSTIALENIDGVVDHLLGQLLPGADCTKPFQRIKGFPLWSKKISLHKTITMGEGVSIAYSKDLCVSLFCPISTFTRTAQGKQILEILNP